MDTEHFMATLRKRGYKVTPQRLAIFETVVSSHDHPTAEQIHQRVTDRNPAISMATVYHVLHLLKELRLLQELGAPEGSSRFDPNTTPHVNVICPRCGEVYDYNGADIGRFWSQIVSELDVEPIGHRMDLYVVCKNCINKPGAIGL